MTPLFKIGQEVQVNDTYSIEYLLGKGHTTKGTVYSIVITNNGQIQYTVAFTDGSRRAQYGFREEKLQAVSNTFNSQAEIWEYLLSGGKVQSYHTKAVLELKDGEVYSESSTVVKPEDITFFNYKYWTKYTEPAKWYDNIPKSGILCWVYDNEPNDKTTCRIVLGYTDGSFTTSGMSWEYATPLTQEEVTNLTLQQ